MIILPDTPPNPSSITILDGSLSPQLVSMRASIASSGTKYNSELVRDVVRLEDYLEELFRYASGETGSSDIPKIISFCCDHTISDSNVPWTNIGSNHSRQEKNKRFEKVFNKAKHSGSQWRLINEIEVAIISICLVYTNLGSILTNELIEADATAELIDETNEKWKQVINYYKRSLSFLSFARNISPSFKPEGTYLNPLIYPLLERISNICIQMSILSKSSWINRNSFNETETFKTNNNGTLCKVAIYVVNELKDCQSQLNNLQANRDGFINLQYTNWNEYLNIIEKYAKAYASLFLSIEKYQQDSLGQAIGLINYGLISLQSKNLNDISAKQDKLFGKLKSKVSMRKNDQYVNDLQSITTMNINKSVFQESSGIILKDITFLFDQLIQLRFKFTKENNNIKFDPISGWQDIDKDSKWPLGCSIPTSTVKPYDPFPNSTETASRDEYSGRGAYY